MSGEIHGARGSQPAASADVGEQYARARPEAALTRTAVDQSVRVRGVHAPTGVRQAEILDAMRFLDVYTPALMEGVRAAGYAPGGKTTRVAEQPLIVSASLKAKLIAAGQAIANQLRDGANVAAMLESVPAAHRLHGLTELPTWLQIDFALTRGADGALEPKLIELQGFPTVLAGTHLLGEALADKLRSIPGFADLKHLHGDYTHETLVAHLRKVVVGNCPLERVVMLDVDGLNSSTAFDFTATQALLGVDVVRLADIQRRGNKLYRVKDGAELPIDRVYSRILFHDLKKQGASDIFDAAHELEVEWTPHPTWQEIWSKQSMLYLDHPAALDTRRLSTVDLDTVDLTRFIAKPLDAYSGHGFIEYPTRELLEAIPESERAQWCIQEKVTYEPFLPAADGGTPLKAEVRLIYLRADDEQDFALTTSFARLSRTAKSNMSNQTEASTGFTPVLFR